ncbi:CASP-like protein 2D1 [Populus trichocarpa]|nr:CASP-like protein 2D1 [Populus trichocarpa]|eukprot:XP_002312076.2 CASP-like protein 2D1 [Populus trichocarpa]
MAREIGNGLGIFFNAMDGGLHGSRLVISLQLIGVVVEFASLLRASRRLNTVVEKGECFWESRILKIAFLPIARGSKWMARDSLRMDVEEPVYARKYMFFVSGICASYAFLAAVSTWIRCFVTKAWLFFVSDQIVAYLMVTSGTAVFEILYLAYNGDREVVWSEALSSYGKFCYRVKVQ